MGEQILEVFGNLPDPDAFQFEMHLDSYVRGKKHALRRVLSSLLAAACSGDFGAPLLFMRSSTRWRHMKEFAEYIHDDFSEFPPSVTKEYKRNKNSDRKVNLRKCEHGH